MRKDLSIIKEIKNRFVEWSSDLLEDKIEPDNIEIIEENKFPKKYVFKPTEKKEKIMRFIDALCAVGVAYNGVVDGEGITFFKIKLSIIFI